MTAYRVELLTRGVPVRSKTHGALGWCSVGLAVGDGRVIVVDTGGFPYRELLTDRLGAASLGVRDVTDVLITHAHWDHISNAALFPAATIRISRLELDWALSLGDDDPLVPVPLIRGVVESGRVEPFSGNEQPVIGIRAIATPGHTPGHTSYAVPTADGHVVFAGDALKNERELRTGVPQMTMDPAASGESIARLAGLVGQGAILACGHDRMLRSVDGSFVELASHPASITVTGADGTTDMVEVC